MEKHPIVLRILFPILLLLGACDRHPRKFASEMSEEVGCVNSFDFKLDAERRGRRFGKRISAFCNTISGVSNKSERVVLLGKLAESISRLKLREYSPLEKESMAADFWLSLEYVSYQLVQNGFEERFVTDFIMNAFREFRAMCFSCGDASDFSDGKGSDARERRRCARALSGSWNDAVVFWEKKSIGTIFYGHPDAAERFKERWLKEFSNRVRRTTNDTIMPRFVTAEESKRLGERSP